MCLSIHSYNVVSCAHKYICTHTIVYVGSYCLQCSLSMALSSWFNALCCWLNNWVCIIILYRKFVVNQKTANISYRIRNTISLPQYTVIVHRYIKSIVVSCCS